VQAESQTAELTEGGAVPSDVLFFVPFMDEV